MSSAAAPGSDGAWGRQLALAPVRPRVPAEAARAVSRLAAAAHRFHRYAHHPLCAAYAPEVIAVGRRLRVCRGCALTWLGLAAGAATGLLVAPSGAAGLALAAFGAVMVAVSLRWRLPKWAGRCAPAVALGAALVSGWAPGLLAAALLGSGLLAYRRRGPDRSACAACPQREAKVCDGLKPVVRRERAVMRLGSARIARAIDPTASSRELI